MCGTALCLQAQTGTLVTIRHLRIYCFARLTIIKKCSIKITFMNYVSPLSLSGREGNNCKLMNIQESVRMHRQPLLKRLD